MAMNVRKRRGLVADFGVLAYGGLHLAMLAVLAVVHLLRRRRKGDEGEQQRQRPHTPPPWWRTVMTRIIPACMCSSMWQ